jgi:hypothetical protein
MGKFPLFYFGISPIYIFDSKEYFCPFTKNQPQIMALTPEQIDQIIRTLTTASLDPDVILEIQTMLDSHSHPPHGTPHETDTPYEKIKTFCAAYVNSLQVLGRGVTQPNYEKEMMLVYMDRNDVSNLMDLVPADGYVAAVMGVYENSSSDKQLTVSLLATDSNFEFVKDHHGNPLNGEQCWKNYNTVQNFSTIFQ